MARTSLPAEGMGYQAPVLETPSSLGQSSSLGQPISTTCLGRIKAACPGAGRPGWEHSNKLGCLVPPPEQVRRGEGGCHGSTDRGRIHSQRSQRTPGPSGPGSAASAPAPPPPWFPLPPLRLPLPPGVAPPQFSHHFHPGQPPLAGGSVPQPGFSPAPAQMWTPWVSSGVQTAHADSMPTNPGPPLSRQEFFREPRRLKEEEKKRSKLAQFPKENSEEQMGHRKIPKGLRRSFPGTASPCRGSSYDRRSYTSCKSSSGSTRTCPSSPSFLRSHSGSYSGSSPRPRGARGRRHNYRARSRAHGHHRSRSRSPPYRRRHLRS